MKVTLNEFLEIVKERISARKTNLEDTTSPNPITEDKYDNILAKIYEIKALKEVQRCIENSLEEKYESTEERIYSFLDSLFEEIKNDMDDVITFSSADDAVYETNVLEDSDED